MFRLSTYSAAPDKFNLEFHDGREGILVYRIKGDRLVWTVQVYFYGSETVQEQEDFDDLLKAFNFALSIKPKENTALHRVMSKRNEA
ncbi:MAG: hypothetical protein E6Q97_15645 [Desulfurellales bacterium]|nr:MAG: hypothetical protein E6Q97_15645 [Desulfurellales bacterium]